ncbi:MAG: sulfotransferase domain-containing protein [Solirubrobacteraceae bacterium]
MAHPQTALLPDFLMIGASKAGTTSMHHYLDQHPEIAMSYPKETNFFTREDYMDALDWYSSCFADTTGLRGEASPRYAAFPRSQHVPERIFALVPQVKLLYLVRDPIERCESHYYHNYFNRSESRGIDQTFAEWEDQDDPLIASSKYGMQLEQYLPFFSMSQIMIVDNRDLREARDATMSSVFSFLGVDPNFSSKAFERKIKDRTKTVRMSRVAARLHHSAPAQFGRRKLPRRIREPLFERTRRVLSPAGAVAPARLSPEVRERVAGLFHEDAARLRELTGLPFSHWSV